MSTLLLPPFDLLVPQSLKEAVKLLGKHKKDVMVMAGGTDVLVQMKAGYKPPYILSLAEIPDLDYLLFDPSQGLRIGAMATMRQIIESQAVKENYAALWQTAAQNGTPQTRNVATVVGNVLRASPSGDCSCAVLAHGARVVLEGPSGRREVDIDKFWLDYMVTARKPNEIAVEVKLPPPDRQTFSAFLALNRTSQDLSKLSAAVSLKMEGSLCKECRMAMGAVAPIPLRLKLTETHLVDMEITEQVFKKVAESALSEIKPIDDVRSTAEYRRMVSGTILRRTIESALSNNLNH
jgi:CO/xanthine dehydrogenase FAD-binding subunit